KDKKVELSRHLGPIAVDNLREALAESLLDAAEGADALVESSATSIDVPPSFKSILFRRGRSSDTRMVVAFSFRSGFSDSALPSLGILIAVFSGPLALATAVAALGVVKTLWQKLVVLRAPQDRHAIRLLDAMGRVGAANLANFAKAEARWTEILRASE